MASRSRLTRSASVRLVVLLDGRVAGAVHQMGNGRLAFVYDDEWRATGGAYPLSLSMPLVVREHGDRAIREYMWGLLPDNPAVLDWWARRHGISRYRIVDLLTFMGEECAGAVQFAPPERAGALMGITSIAETQTLVQWLDERELENRLRELRLNPAAGRATSDTGQFSLAGAQPKTALYQNDAGHWGVPSGRMPTNRILKPPTLGLDDLAYNEHFCLTLASELGMPAALSRVQHFGDEIAIVVERYDRAVIGDRLVRVHQEDCCQALGIAPSRKYEDEGGPTVADIHELLRESSTEPETDCQRFFDATALNWLLAATDAHGKNYSLLHAAGPQLRLAPLYDVITVLPNPQLDPARSRLAMSIGGERQISRIGAVQWQRLARSIGMSADEAIQRIRAVASRLPHAVSGLLSRRGEDERMRQLTERFGEAVVAHAAKCVGRL